MIDAGWVRHVGLSEAGAETLRRAHATHPVADLQIECSLLSRGIEAEILPTCRELGVGVTAYGVLARGLLAGTWSTRDAASLSDIRATVAQLAIAWVLSRGEDIVPLVGTTRRDRLDEAIGAVGLELTQDDLAAVERAVPTGAAAGERYDERQMAMLDSEQRRPSQA
jgi:aryl-alcohol dehydrogenase-like predicted oxidoreductase